jgi:pilus assembly protein CpaB
MRRPIAFVVLAGVAAVLASLVVYSALKRREAEVKQAMSQTVEIVVAAHDLPLGSKLEPGAVKLTRWAKDSIPPGAFTDQQTVLNGNAFVKSSFVENEPIVASKLFMGEKTAGVMPFLIPAGMRAMSVQVDEVSDIAGFVLPHTRVDVLVAVSGGGNEKPFAKLVLQNVEVLAVAQEVEGKKDQPQLVKTVTLLVSPEDAERLALASHEGSLRLAMRSYNDDKIVLTSGTDVAALLHAYSTVPLIAHQGHTQLARAQRSARPAVSVEIIRDGTKRNSVSFISDAAIGPTSDKTQAKTAVAPDKTASAAGVGESTAGFMTPRARTIEVP